MHITYRLTHVRVTRSVEERAGRGLLAFFYPPIWNALTDGVWASLCARPRSHSRHEVEQPAICVAQYGRHLSTNKYRFVVLLSNNSCCQLPLSITINALPSRLRVNVAGEDPAAAAWEQHDLLFILRSMEQYENDIPEVGDRLPARLQALADGEAGCAGMVVKLSGAGGQSGDSRVSGAAGWSGDGRVSGAAGWSGDGLVSGAACRWGAGRVNGAGGW